MKYLYDVRLSTHFYLSEFMKTSVADYQEITFDSLKHLIYGVKNVIEPARCALGVPIFVGSGYRSVAVNRLVGGVRTSFHLTGYAADLQVKTENQFNHLWSILESNPHVVELFGCPQEFWLHVSWTKDKVEHGDKEIKYYYYKSKNSSDNEK